MRDNYVIRQRDIIDLLSKNGIEPEDVRTLHLNLDESWVEVCVRDERGRLVVERDAFGAFTGFASTVVPVEIRSMYSGEVI